MTLISIDTKVVGSSNYNEKKVLASDINQIKGALQTGSYDVKPYNIEMEGNTITADGGQNWIRRYGNTFQYYDGTWKAPATETTGSFVAGEDLAARDVVYINTSDGKIYKTDVTDSSKIDWIGIVDTGYAAGNTATVHLNSSAVGGFSGLITGNWYKLSSTPGAIETSDLTTNNVGYNVGIAISSTQLLITKQQLTQIANKVGLLLNDAPLTDLRLTSLEVNAGVSGVTDNFEDIFSTADGALGTVNLINTTSIFNNTDLNYYNDVINKISIDNNTYSTTNGNFVLIHTWDNLNYNNIYKLDATLKSTSSSTTSLYFILYYYDGTNFQTETQSVNNETYTIKNYNVDNNYINKNLIKIEAYGTNTMGYTGFFKDFNIYYNSIGNTDIYLDYNKGKPTSLYFALYSGVGTTDTSEIGDCTIELLTGTTSLGIYNPYTLYNGLSLASTPDTMIIHQADTSLSKISKFVTLIEG